MFILFVYAIIESPTASNVQSSFGTSFNPNPALQPPAPSQAGNTGYANQPPVQTASTGNYYSNAATTSSQYGRLLTLVTPTFAPSLVS